MDKAKISAIILLLITIAIVLSFNFDVTTVHDADQSLLYVNESYSLSPTEQGITSSSLYALNNSYLSFDGVNDYVIRSPLSYLNNSLNFTVSGWFKLNNATQGTYILTNSLDTNSRFSVSLNSGRLKAGYYNGSFQGSKESSILSADTWYFYTYSIFNGNNSILTLNNIIQTGTSNPATALNANFTLGVRTDLTGYFNGLIDDVRIYNRSLLESEITEIYNSGRYKNLSLPSDGLVLYMPFEETNGTTIYDNSGNNNNGELIYE